MKRLISIDIFRGVAILGVILAHCLLFNVDVETDITLKTTFIGNLIWYLLTWAGFFGIISGVGNTIAIYGRVRQGIWTPKKALANSLLGGTIYLLVNYLYLWFFVPGYPPVEHDVFMMPVGQIGGVLFWLIRNGEIFTPPPEQLLYGTALIMIGWGIIISGISVYFITRKRHEGVSTRNFIILGTIATLFVTLYPIIQTYLRALVAPLLPLSWENFWVALVPSWLVAPMDPIFPYAGFSLYGVIFSLMIVDKVDKRKTYSYGYIVGLLYSLIGFSYNFFVKYEMTAYDTPPFWALLSILGPMLLLMTACLQFIDFSSAKLKVWLLNQTKTIRTFGLVSLSLFVFEGPFAAVVRQVLNFILPDFNKDYFLLICVFMPIVIVLWIIVVRLWAKMHFKGSIEWAVTLIMGRLTGKKTNRLDYDYIINGTAAYIEQSTEQHVKILPDAVPDKKIGKERRETREIEPHLT